MPPGDDHREARLAVAGIVPYWHVPPSCPECEGDVDREDAWWCEGCSTLLCAAEGCAEEHAARCGASVKEGGHGPG